MTQKYCFPPVVTEHTQILILGSLPGEASLLAQQYYAHPRNQFWSLLSTIVNDNLATLSYPEKLYCLKSHGIGLWDIVANAKREGSLDSRIREASYNDLTQLILSLPKLHIVAFNGQTAGKAALALPKHIPHLILPSSSPAYTLSFEQKKIGWAALRQFL